jgi:hypothetical protein
MKYKQQKYIIIFSLVICIILLIYKISIKKNVDNLVILYVIRSIPKYYETRIKSQYDTWFKFLTKNDKVLIASEKKNHNNKFDLNYNIPDCPPGHGDGPCCSESNALVKALNNYKFDWIFILDDDVYLYPPKVREIINKYKDNHDIAIGTVGCGAKDISGFCGGGGYGFSRRVLEKLIDNNENEFLNIYKNHCNNTQYCDITTADLLVKKNIELINIPELRPWGIQKSDENDILENKVATLHYYGGELTKDYKEIPEKMGYLHNLFKKIKENSTNFKEFFSNRDRITNLITTSPIPSMPSINIIKRTIESLKLIPYLYNAPLIICFDGYEVKNDKLDNKCTQNDSIDKQYIYDEYKRNVKEYLKDKTNVTFIELKERECLTNSIIKGLEYVNTKYINIIQHDLILIKSFNIENILNIMDDKKNNINLVRYVYNTNEWHQNYVRNEGCKDDLDDNNTIIINRQKFSQCNHFGDNNHIVSTEFYKTKIVPKLKEYTFPEYDIRCYPIDYNDYSFYYLGDINDGYYIRHIDGRNTKL